MFASEPPEQPRQQLSKEAQGFDYDALDSETRIIAKQRASEIKSLTRQTAQHIIDIGEKLVEIKERLVHGSFRSWLRSEFDWSITTAHRFMRVTEQFKSFSLEHLDIAATALYLLASPSTPDEARQEALKLASLGETITHSKAKAIVSQHKEAKPNASKPLMFDVSAQSMEYKSSTAEYPKPAEPAPQTKPALESLDEPDYVGNEEVTNLEEHDASEEDQSEEDLLGKDLEPEPLQGEVDEFEVEDFDPRDRMSEHQGELEEATLNGGIFSSFTNNAEAKAVPQKYTNLNIDVKQNNSEDELNHKAEQIDKIENSAQILPEMRQNSSNQAGVGVRPLVASLSPDIEIKNICKAFCQIVKDLTNSDPHIPSISLGLHEWPDAALKRIIKEAKYELTSRHHTTELGAQKPLASNLEK